jgi:hypothetical protein
MRRSSTLLAVFAAVALLASATGFVSARGSSSDDRPVASAHPSAGALMPSHVKSTSVDSPSGAHRAVAAGPAEPLASAARVERDGLLAELRQSGPDVGGLLPRARRLGQILAELSLENEIHATVTPWECHARGCATSVVQHSEVEADELTTRFTKASEFHAWSSAKLRSGAIPRSDGRIEVTWFFWAPDTSPTSGRAEPLDVAKEATTEPVTSK